MDQGTAAPASQPWLGKLPTPDENTLLCCFVLSSAGIQKPLTLSSIALLEVCWGGVGAWGRENMMHPYPRSTCWEQTHQVPGTKGLTVIMKNRSQDLNTPKRL